MAENPYSVLGVGKEASDAEIRSAYRKLAKKLHPDLNPGDKNAESQFKTVSAAYELLSDKEKRAKFDRGEIDEEGQPKAERAWYRPHAEGADGARYASSAGYEDFSDLFSDIFAQQRGGTGGGPGGMGGGGSRRANMQFPGDDIRYTLTVDFLEAAAGAKKRLTMPDGKVLDLSIPEGIEDEQTLRLKGQGGPGYNGGPAGDALVEIHIAPHAFFERHDKDVLVELPVTLAEAVLGGKIEVPTVHGPVSMTVPKWSNAGTVLRLRGRGIKRSGSAGDQLVTLKIVLPDQEDEDLERFVADWAPKQTQDPRAKMRSAS
jgi:DnaJ-class molecular chaperone